jgi:hypothetical protein
MTRYGGSSKLVRGAGGRPDGREGGPCRHGGSQPHCWSRLHVISSHDNGVGVMRMSRHLCSTEERCVNQIHSRGPSTCSVARTVGQGSPRTCVSCSTGCRLRDTSTQHTLCIPPLRVKALPRGEYYILNTFIIYHCQGSPDAPAPQQEILSSAATTNSPTPRHRRPGGVTF